MGETGVHLSYEVPFNLNTISIHPETETGVKVTSYKPSSAAALLNAKRTCLAFCRLKRKLGAFNQEFGSKVESNTVPD